MKRLLIGSVLMLSFSMTSVAKEKIRSGTGFSAPAVIDVDSIFEPAVGDIVFEASPGSQSFYGWDGVDWINFGATSTPAGPTTDGIVTTGTQTFAGAKTFSNNVAGTHIAKFEQSSALASDTDRGLVAYSHRFQTKTLASNQSMPSSETNLSALSFTNLTVGRAYRVSGQLDIQVATSNQPAIVLFRAGSGGTVLGASVLNVITGTGEARYGLNFVFTATHITLQASLSGAGSTSGVLLGDGTRLRSFVTLEEIPAEEVSTW